ncbi:hypothetical protein SNE40_019478 [Patella caerulea]|uniref:LisH domain-containing protein n=1 Tax=Patella caerulea TaxID=87958 RepID=A0AAN8J7E7_PATCE
MENQQQHYFLPSEIARLVLGYLQDVGCKMTVKYFIKESKDLVEYSALLKKGLNYPTSINGLTLIAIINEYATYKLQDTASNQWTVSTASLWKQFDNVTRSLKKATKSKIRQPETQSTRTKKSLQKRKTQKVVVGHLTDTDVVHNSELSDEGWESDNSQTDNLLDNTINLNDTHNNSNNEITPGAGSSTLKLSPSSCKIVSPPNLTPPLVNNSASKRNKSRTSATKTKSSSATKSNNKQTLRKSDDNSRQGDVVRRQTRSVSAVKNSTVLDCKKKGSKICTSPKRTCTNDSKNVSVNSFTSLVISEEQKGNESMEFSLHESDGFNGENNSSADSDDGERPSNTSVSVSVKNVSQNGDISTDDNLLTQSVGSDQEQHSRVKNRDLVQQSRIKNSDLEQQTIINSDLEQQTMIKNCEHESNCIATNDENSQVFNNLSSVSRSPGYYNQPKQPSTEEDQERIAPPTSPQKTFQPIDETSQFNPITPQKTFQPIDDETSQFNTPLKTFTQYHSDHPHHHRSPRRKRQPPKRHTVIGGHETSSTSQFQPFKPEIEEHTTSEYPDLLERLLQDTKFHEKLAEDINKKLIPRKQSLDVAVVDQCSQKAADETFIVPNNTDFPPLDKNSNHTFSSSENVNSMSDLIIKNIADVTGNDPSFEAVFNFFVHTKESSIHAEMDQMMTSASHPTNQQINSNDQKETGLHTPPELVDNYMNEDNNRHVSSCHSDQPILLQNGHLDHDVPHNLPINDNSNNSNSNVINSASNFQQDCIITNSTSNCSSLEHVNMYYSSVPVTGNINLLKSTDNHPVLNSISNHDYMIQQPHSVLSQSSMSTLVEQDTTSTVQNLVNLNSPAISISSIASPDPGFIATSERRPNSETKTKRPKRITPTPLCGNEVLPNIGKIASPQKPLVVIPEKANEMIEMSYNGYVVCGESYKTPTTFEIQEHNPERSNGFEETHGHHCETPTSQFNPMNNVNTSFATSESNSIQMISDSYPELSQAEQCETSVCDIAMSPGGKNLLLHNKRSLRTALEENRMILSPINPVNQNSQSSSSTPNNQFPIPLCNLSKPIIKSPDKEFRKPNTTCASKATRASPRIAKLSKEKVVPTCYTLVPHDDKPSIVPGSTEEESFTAVPLGVISKRLCHVRNLDFGPEAVAVNAEDNPVTVPKSKIEMRRVATIAHLSSTALSTVSNGGKTVISLTDANVRDWKPKVSIAKKSASTENSNSSDKCRSPQLIIQRLSPEAIKPQIFQAVMPQTLEPKGKRKHRKTRNLDKPETKVKPAPKIVTAAAKKVVSTKIPASAEPSALSKFSPLVKKGKASKKTKTSRHKKSTTSKSKKIVPPEIPVNTPSEIVNVPPEIVDILDADTKEFNQQFQIISSLSNSVPVIQSVDNIADNVNTGTVSDLDSAAISFEQKETNEAAEVLASLSMAMPSNAVPPPVTTELPVMTEQITSGKRKATDTSINDSWKSADSPNIVQKRKKRKKAPDLKSVNIDALLSKIKYK